MERLNEILNAVQTLTVQVAQLHESRTNQQQNIERFWAKDWADLMQRLDNISNLQRDMDGRIGRLEQMMHHVPEDVARANGRIDSIERRLQTMSMSIIVIGVIALGTMGAKIAPLI